MKSTTSPPRIEVHHDRPPSAAALHALQVLQQAVVQELDRKRRLGQYAVVWQDGAVRKLPPEALPVWAPANEGGGASAPSGSEPLASRVAAREPLPGGSDDPEDPPLRAQPGDVS